MPAVALKVTGIPEVEAAIRAAALRSAAQAAEVVEDNLDVVVRNTQALTPYGDGDQRSTVRKEMDEGGLSGRVVVGGVPGKVTGKMVDYAAANELGVTRGPRAGKHPVQPSLGPAYEAQRPEFVRDLEAVADGRAPAPR